MPIPDFLQFQCASTESPLCAACPKDFIMPISSIEGIYKASDGNALIFIKDTHYVPYPACGDRLRFIKTTIPYADIVAELDGKIYNMGNIVLVEESRVSKR